MYNCRCCVSCVKKMYKKKINHAVDVEIKIVNFSRERALNYRQLVMLLEEHEIKQDNIGYHTPVQWLSLGKVLKRVCILRAEI